MVSNKAVREPQRASSRLVALDIARALALFGIILVHVLGPTGTSGHLPEGFVWGNSVAPALFALLSGTSLALASGGAAPLQEKAARRHFALATAVRAGFIGLIGVALTGLGSGVAVILTYFAALFLVAIPLLWLSPRKLFAGALLGATVGAAAVFALRPYLPPRAYDAPLWGDFAQPLQLFSHLFFTGYYPVSAWLVYLMAGLALGRLNLRSRTVQVRALWLGSAVAASAWAVSKLALSTAFIQERLLREAPGETWESFSQAIAPGLYGAPPPASSPAWLLVAVPHASTPADLFYTAGYSVALVGALLLAVAYLAKWPLAVEALRVAFGAGTMTLTLYTLHVVMHSPLLPPKDTPSTLGFHLWVVVVLGAVFALLRKRGPLEYVAGLVGRSPTPATDRAKLR